MKITGIDNGFKGGLVTLDTVLGTMKVSSKIVMPTNKMKNGKHELDELALLEYLTMEHPTIVFIEKAQSMPGQGVSGMFRYGEGYGITKGIVFALGIKRVVVRPQEWQKEMFPKGSKKDTKELSYSVCRDLLPGESWLATSRSKRFHTGLVDAAVIALYGLRVYQKEFYK